MKIDMMKFRWRTSSNLISEYLITIMCAITCHRRKITRYVKVP